MSRMIRYAALIAAILFSAAALSPVAEAQDYGAPTIEEVAESTAGDEVLAEQEEQLLNAIRALRDCGAITPSAGTNSEPDPRDVTIVISESLANCATNVVFQINPVLYDGPVPSDRIVPLYMPLEFDAPWVVDLTADLRTGGTYVQTFTFFDTGSNAANAGLTGSEAPASPPLSLAFTGGSVSTPLAAGGAMIVLGLGALLVARRREDTTA